MDEPERVETLHRTNASVLAGVRFGEVEEIWYESPDGLDIQGWIVKPPDFDPSSKYPLILRIHGGRTRCTTADSTSRIRTTPRTGMWCSDTNPRGSSGYGSSFGNEIKNAYPGKDLDDLLAGVDEVLSRGYIDERNLFVYGGSGGGVLTSWIVGNTDPLHRRGGEGAGDQLAELRGHHRRRKLCTGTSRRCPGTTRKSISAARR